MSTLKEKAQSILTEKDLKILPENIKRNVTVFDVVGELDSGGGEVFTISMTNSISVEIESTYPEIQIPFTLNGVDDLDGIYVKIYGREKNSEYSWQINYDCNVSADASWYYIEKPNYIISLYPNFYSDYYDNEYKLEFLFVKGGYVAVRKEVALDLVIPNYGIFDIFVYNVNGFAIPPTYFSLDNLQVYDENDELVTDLNVQYYNDWTIRYHIKPLVADKLYKFKFIIDGVVRGETEYTFTSESIASGNFNAMTSLYTDIKCGSIINVINQSGMPEKLLKITTIQKDSESTIIYDNIDYAPTAMFVYPDNGATYTSIDFRKPGYVGYGSGIGEFNDFVENSTTLEKLTDDPTKSAIDIVIGPWQDEQAGITNAAPEDLDIEVYLQNASDVYEPGTTGINGNCEYICNLKENISSVAIYGLLGKNVKLVLNDQRYTFNHNEREMVLEINEWGYTIGLYPVNN